MTKNLLTIPLMLLLSISNPLHAATTKVQKDIVVKPTTSTPITTAPKGTTFESQRRDGFSMFNTTFGTDSIHHTFSVGKYIKGDDGCLYIYSPFFKKPTRSYLKLDPYKDNIYVAHTPQAIYEDYYEETTDYATRLELVMTDNGPEYTVATDKNGTPKTDLFFELNGEELKQVDEGKDAATHLPKVVLGYTEENGAWKWYAESEMIFQPLKDEKTTLPSTIDPKKDMEQFILSYMGEKNDAQSILIEGTIKNNEIFIHNPYHRDEEQWIKGTIVGRTVSFKPQYMGIDSRRMTHVYFQPASFYKTPDSKTGEEYSVYRLRTELIFDYDTETQTLTALDKSAFLINGGNLRPAYMAAYDIPTIKKYQDKAATPKAPVIKEATPYSDPIGGSVNFTIEAKDINGEYILPQKLFYRIYLNHSDKPMVFKKDKYRKLKEDITDMMSFATNYVDIEINGNNRIVWIYEPDYKSIGVQTVYKGGKEVKTSDIIWYELESTGIISHESVKEVIRTQYFNMMGLEVQKPQHGTFIKKVTYRDGTQSTQKIVF